jgi:isochorismate synthase
MTMDLPTRTPDPAQATGSAWHDFRPGDSLFASPDGVFHGRGCLLQAAPDRDVGACASELLRQARMASSGGVPAAHRVLLGLLPFDPAQPARLLIPGELRRMAFPPELPPQRPTPVLSRRAWPTGAAYEDGVRQALALLESDPALRKLVLARTLELELPTALDLPQTIARLWRRNPHGYTYALPLSPDGGRTFIGASPELLVQRTGRHVFVHPLAGTAVRASDPDLDTRNGQTLLHSAKDRLEHAVVVEAIEAALRPLCRRLDIPAQPSLTATDRLWHLGTPITGELEDPALHALDLAIALHPTPAVCGLPTARARRAIADIEPFERGYYAGAVGWCDANGDGVWSVAIRCAEVSGRRLTLYAGAGIVPGSVPEQERRETGNKLRTVLDALGLESNA